MDIPTQTGLYTTLQGIVVKSQEVVKDVVGGVIGVPVLLGLKIVEYLHIYFMHNSRGFF